MTKFQTCRSDLIVHFLLESSLDQSGDGNKFKSSRNTVLENPQTDVYQNLCCHKKHLRLESLKTLILADNALTKIQLSTDDITTFSETEETEWTNIGVTKLRLLYPNLSMLDISNNCLKVRQSITFYFFFAQYTHQLMETLNNRYLLPSFIAGSAAISA